MEHTGHMPHMHHPKSIHTVLGFSYFFYFTFFLLGLILDLIYPINVFQGSWTGVVGAILLILGSIVIVWAQIKSKTLDRMKENFDKYVFRHGPYKFAKAPTHYGLFLLIMGFALIENSFFLIVTTMLAFSISRVTFLKKLEHLLTEKYGQAYVEYKKMVHL